MNSASKSGKKIETEKWLDAEMRKSIIESTVVVWINFGKAVGILQAGMASCVHESLWTQHELQQYENDGELKPWERWSKKVHRVSSWSSQKTMAHWTTYVMNTMFWQGRGITETLQPGQKGWQNATGSMEVTRTAACNFTSGNPQIVILRVNGLFLSLTFFADAPNICTRNSIINTKRDNTWSVFQWWAKKQAFE